PPPAFQRGAADAIDAGTIALEVATKGAVEQTLRVLARDRGVAEVEPVLPVDVGQVYVRQHSPLAAHLGEQRRARYRRVEHELVEIGIVRYRVLDLVVNILRGMVLQPDDRRAQQLDA